MTNGSDRLDRIERILEQSAKRQEQFDRSMEQSAKRQEQFDKGMEEVNRALREMAARQQYHDEAFDRHDATMKQIQESIAALVLVTRSHHRRLNDLDGGEPA